MRHKKIASSISLAILFLAIISITSCNPKLEPEEVFKGKYSIGKVAIHNNKVSPDELDFTQGLINNIVDDSTRFRGIIFNDDYVYKLRDTVVFKIMKFGDFYYADELEYYDASTHNTLNYISLTELNSIPLINLHIEGDDYTTHGTYHSKLHIMDIDIANSNSQYTNITYSNNPSIPGQTQFFCNTSEFLSLRPSNLTTQQFISKIINGDIDLYKSFCEYNQNLGADLCTVDIYHVHTF